jgi:hypothetical protein
MASASRSREDEEMNRSRRFYRSRTDRKIAGSAAGSPPTSGLIR